jgi:hypothetical protein
MHEEMPVRLRADPERVRVSVRRVYEKNPCYPDDPSLEIRIESRADPSLFLKRVVGTRRHDGIFALIDLVEDASKIIDGIDLVVSRIDRGFDHPFGRMCSCIDEFRMPGSEEEEGDL